MILGLTHLFVNCTLIQTLDSAVLDFIDGCDVLYFNWSYFYLIEIFLRTLLKTHFTSPYSVTLYMCTKFCCCKLCNYANISVQEGCEISVSPCVVRCRETVWLELWKQASFLYWKIYSDDKGFELCILVFKLLGNWEVQTYLG